MFSNWVFFGYASLRPQRGRIRGWLPCLHGGMQYNEPAIFLVHTHTNTGANTHSAYFVLRLLHKFTFNLHNWTFMAVTPVTFLFPHLVRCNWIHTSSYLFLNRIKSVNGSALSWHFYYAGEETKIINTRKSCFILINKK